MKSNVYFCKEDVLRIKNIQDDKLRIVVDQIISSADEIMKTEPLTEDMVTCDGNGDVKYGNQHENYYDASNPLKENIPVLAFAYYYTGNKKYADKAKDFMLMYSGYKKWHGKGYHGRSELVTAAFCVGMGYGYSLFYDELTVQERKTIAEATYRLGILPTFEDWLLPNSKIHAIDTMGHNWWIIIVSDATLALLSMKDETDDSGKLIQTALEGIREWFNYKGNPINMKPVNFDNGAFYESVSYYDFALGEYLRLRKAYKALYNKNPFDDETVIAKSSEFFAKMTYVSNDKADYVNFGDTHSFNKNSDCSAVLMSPFLMLGQIKPERYHIWYVKNVRKRKIKVEDALFFAEIHYSNAGLNGAASAYYSEIGWAMFRDGFEKNGTMLAIKCGDTWNHAHCDAGHFILCRNGEDEVYDSGSCSYVDPLYFDYYVSSRAHNVVLFNGNGQDARDIRDHVRMKGRLYNFVDKNGFRYVAADATGPMSRYFRKHIRHFLWLDNFVLIYDDIEAYEDGEVSFLLHANSKTCFRMLTDCQKESRSGYRTQAPEKAVEYTSYTQQTQNCRAKFVSVLALDEGADIAYGETDNIISVRADKITIHINLLSDGRIMHQNCINVIDGITTDAVMLIEAGSKFGAVNGSIIRKGGISYLDTLVRVNGWIEEYSDLNKS